MLTARGPGAARPRRSGRHGKAAVVLAAVAAVLVLTSCITGSGSQSDQPAGAKRGGTAVIAMVQEPGGMNELFHDQSGAFIGGEGAWVVEPLFMPRPDGSYAPALAAEIPTVENGGIANGGRTVTYRLREGVTWSDGKPFTAADLEFTFKVFQDDRSTALVPAEYDLVQAVRARDPRTVEVTMSGPNPSYLDLWKRVLPAHKFTSTAVTAKHPQARLPLGTGPFVFTAFDAGNQITLKRNPKYWRDPNLPHLEGITLKIVPERDVAMSAFLDGQYDSVFFFTTADLPQLTKAADGGAPIVVETQKTDSWVEWLFVNHSRSGDPQQPHPVLADPAVREAISSGIDRQSIIKNVLGGFGKVVGSPIYSGTFDVDLPADRFDADHARQVLDTAGWRPGPGGIRVKDGVRAQVKFQTIAGDHGRELYQQIIQQNLREIGIDVRIENVPSNLIFGGFSEGGLLATGKYDLLMSRDGRFVDPANWISQFTCDSIPTKQQPSGFTYAHYCNKKFDELVQRAGSTLDVEQRKQLYRQVAQVFHDERIAIPIYSSTWGWAWNQRLQGVSAANYWGGIWPSVADWHLSS